MGKLLIGHYGSAPDAESVSISLKDCHQRLGLKPSDFVSEEDPSFFRKAHGAHGKYLVFQLAAGEIQDAVWKAGYYLLPLEAADVLNRFSKQELTGRAEAAKSFELECKESVPPDIYERASRWALQSQPLLFKCQCPQLVLKLDAPSLLRSHWKARLGCENRCQPPLKTLI